MPVRRLLLLALLTGLTDPVAAAAAGGGGGTSDSHQVELTVSRGYFAYIQPTDLPPATTSRHQSSNSSTDCKISVELNDLSTLQVGDVQPHV